MLFARMSKQGTTKPWCKRSVCLYRVAIKFFSHAMPRLSQTGQRPGQKSLSPCGGFLASNAYSSLDGVRCAATTSTTVEAAEHYRGGRPPVQRGSCSGCMARLLAVLTYMPGADVRARLARALRFPVWTPHEQSFMRMMCRMPEALQAEV